MPLAAWLRQRTPTSQIAGFLAPNFVHADPIGGEEVDATTTYAGLVGITRAGRGVTWFYGGAAARESGETVFYPYLGALWQPRPDWAVSLLAPWPGVVYAPSPRYNLRLGAGPAGAVLATSHDGQRLRVSYTSWNFQLTGSCRFGRSFWLSAGGGWSGKGAFRVGADGQPDLEVGLNRRFVGTLQLSFRPAAATAPAPRSAP
jgi:hypothetical protein